MVSYLVTGGCGFIGSNIAHALVARGDHVRILDDLSTGREQNLAGLHAAGSGSLGNAGQLELVRGDILDPCRLDSALRGIDYVLHHAAVPSVPWSVEQPLSCDRVNSHGTLQVLEAARRSGRVRRVVLAASCAAYGDYAEQEAKREDHPTAPLSPYAAAKLASEQYCAVYSRVYGLPTVVLRYFNIFGPRQDPSSHYAAVLPRFIDACLRGQAPTVFGDGLQSRDFCYVDNVVEANLLACAAPAERVAGRVINIGCGQSYTLVAVLEELGRLVGRPIAPRHAEPRPGEVRHSRADIGLAAKLLGYAPTVSFAEGLRRTLAWYTALFEGAPNLGSKAR
jgi:UDP-glucose 4-epimerase